MREEVSQARTKGREQAVEELREAGDVFVCCVALDEECVSQGPLSVTVREGDLAIALSHLFWGRRSHLRLERVEWAILLRKRSSVVRGILYSGDRRVEGISAGDVTLIKLRRSPVASPTFRRRAQAHRHNSRHTIQCSSAHW